MDDYVRFGYQAVHKLGITKPAVHGTTIDTHNARNNFRAFSPLHSTHRLQAPPFQLRSGTKWSTHTNVRGPD